MEEKINDQPVSQEKFEKEIHSIAENNKEAMLKNFDQGVLYLRSYAGVSTFKSIRRAIRRGHVSIYGDIYPSRPFNNRKRGLGTDTYNKRRIYESITHKKGKVC